MVDTAGWDGEGRGLMGLECRKKGWENSSGSHQVHTGFKVKGTKKVT